MFAIYLLSLERGIRPERADVALKILPFSGEHAARPANGSVYDSQTTEIAEGESILSGEEGQEGRFTPLIMEKLEKSSLFEKRGGGRPIKPESNNVG